MMISIQCPSCGHYDTYEKIEDIPVKCTYCDSWYIINEVTSYRTKLLKSDEAIRLLVKKSNERGY